jgi:hypothetical protein
VAYKVLCKSSKLSSPSNSCANNVSSFSILVQVKVKNAV